MHVSGHYWEMCRLLINELLQEEMPDSFQKKGFIGDEDSRADPGGKVIRLH